MHQKVWHDARDLYLLCLLDVVLNRIPEKVSELSAKSEKDFTAWLSNQSFEHRKEYNFLNCKRARGVWSAFSPTLSALLATPFSVNVKTAFFHLWPSVGDRVDRLARFIIKTVLYSIWSFRNKTTFYNRTDMSGLLYGTSGTTLPCACELIICASLRIILRLCGTTPVFVKFLVPNLKLF